MRCTRAEVSCRASNCAISAHRPKSMSTSRPCWSTSRLPGCGSEWKKPTCSSCVRKQSTPTAVRALMTSGGERASCSPSIHSVTSTLRRVAAALCQAYQVARLLLVVELEVRGASEGVEQRHVERRALRRTKDTGEHLRLEPLHRLHVPPRQVEVERDGTDHVWPLHLERDLLAALAHPAAVHLAERRRGNGLRALVQAREDLARRHTQLTFYEPQRVGRRVGRHGIAQLLQLVHRRRWQQAGPRPTSRWRSSVALVRWSSSRCSAEVDVLTVAASSASRSTKGTAAAPISSVRAIAQRGCSRQTVAISSGMYLCGSASSSIARYSSLAPPSQRATPAAPAALAAPTLASGLARRLMVMVCARSVLRDKGRGWTVPRSADGGVRTTTGRRRERTQNRHGTWHMVQGKQRSGECKGA
eukprot:scaffold61213_cov79-Phaeocystis_antarctica.AAC.2